MRETIKKESSAVKIWKHIEYTVTLACSEYDSGHPCPGCVLPKKREEALTKDPRFGKRKIKYEINPDFIIKILRELNKEGYRVVTLMGGEPLAMRRFNEVITWISRSRLTAAIYVGLPKLFLTDDKKLNDFYELYREAGLFDKNLFGYLKFSTNSLLLKKKEIPQSSGPQHTSAVKTYYGLRVAELLAEKGTPPTIHQTITKDNIDQTLPLYYWAKERGIGFSCSPMVWAWRSPQYATIKALKKSFPGRLTEKQRPQLEKISQILLGEAIDQITQGEKRLIIPSSAFLRLLPHYGINNNISCFPISENNLHRNGQQPEIQDIYPDGTRRYCIAQDNEKQAKKCLGCFGSAGVDRSNGYYNFETLRIKPNDFCFLNGDEPRKKTFEINIKGTPRKPTIN